MRQRALHSAGDVTASNGREDRPVSDGRDRPATEPTNRDDPVRRTPSEFGLPAAPAPDCGLVPTTTASAVVDDGPLSALHSQRFAGVPLSHGVTFASGERGVTLTATLTNESEALWGYRVPSGPAPFAGGRSVADGGELAVTPLEDEELFSDGVLRPGESVRSTLSVSALGSPGARWPEGEHTILQPLTVWTEERAYSYNWELTVEV